jgi:HK97 family phage major capsid protein
MTTRISELRAANVANARMAHDLNAKFHGKIWTPAAQATYDAHINVIERNKAEIAALERTRAGQADATVQDAIDTAYRERRVVPFEPLLDGFLRKGPDGFSDQQKLAIRNTLSTTTGSQGGFTVPSDAASRFADILKNYSGVRRVAEIFKTTTGNVFSYPTSDGTGETGERLAENATATALDPSFGSAPLPTWKYSSKIFTVPFELLSDSNIDIEAYVFSRAAARIGRITNTDFTVGTGSSQPQGFAGVASSGKVGTTGQTTSIIHDDIVDLVHSVNTSYRQVPQGLAFQMADVTFKFIRKIKDATTNRPVYLPADGVQLETLLGYPVIVNDDVAVMAANAKSVFFGNWEIGYKIRDSLEVHMFRFTDSVYATKGQVGFLAIARSGGNLVDTTAIKAYSNSAT